MSIQIPDKKASVVVVMSTYNGEKYISEQIQSLFNQNKKPSSVFVRDDGSSDNTKKILEEWKSSTNGWLQWYEGENLGPGRSFLEALSRAPEADYYSLCDQDDVWYNDKIEYAINLLEKSDNRYKIYVSNVALADNNLNIYGQTNFRANTTLQSALIYNQAVGCTIIINNELRKQINAYTPDYMFMHDCWIYRVCAALGGELIFDNSCHMKYRQHQNNHSGGSKNKFEIWKKRIISLFGNKKNMRKNTAFELLKGYTNLMTEDNRIIVKKLAEYNKSFKNKKILIKDKKIYSESRIGNMGIKLSILFGKL